MTAQGGPEASALEVHRAGAPLPHCLHRIGVEPVSPVAGAPHHEDRGIVEEPVEGAQQRILARE